MFFKIQANYTGELHRHLMYYMHIFLIVKEEIQNELDASCLVM